MRVHRLIFRLDFRRPNFAIIDAPGTVMRMISEMGDATYWSEFQDSSSTRAIAGTTRDLKEGMFRQFSVEPTAMFFVLESTKGIRFASLGSDSTIGSLLKGVHTVCEAFKAEQFSRAGIRFIAMGSIPTTAPSLLPTAESLLDNQLLNRISSTLGTVTDIGFALDGESDDNLKYHLRFGPHKAGEAKKYFSAETAKQLEDGGNNANFIADIDIFEQDFAMTVRANQWCKAPIEKAQKITRAVTEFISNR